jgi:ABC-type phosphate transport system substrate-binding protein
LAVLGVVGCLAFPAVSNAAAPTGGGTNCQNDGHIDGRGSTLQDNLQELDWNVDYQMDVCGPLANNTTGNSTLPDGASVTLPGTTMIAYNYGGALTNANTGSGQGIQGSECRTDAFWGTDNPYNQTQWTAMQAGGETTSTCARYNSGGTNPLTPPFAPLPTYPAATDVVTASSAGGPAVMSFPVAAAAVDIVINFTTAAGCTSANITGAMWSPAGTCTANPPIVTGCPAAATGLQFTGQQISEIMGGQVTNWNQLSSNPVGTYGLASESPADDGLATCNLPLTRIVRADNSGTTNILQNYMINTDGARNTGPEAPAGAPCPGTASGSPGTTANPPETWNLYQAWPGSNASWPGYPNLATGNPANEPTQNASDGTCSTLFFAGHTTDGGVTFKTNSGGPALFGLLQNISGGVGYLDLSDAVDAAENPNGDTIAVPSLPAGDGSGYQVPQSGSGANCVVTTSFPTGSPAAAVGLLSTNNWANNNSVNHDNITNAGSKYPLCGMTWQLTYTQQDQTVAHGLGPVSTLNIDQRQTLYSYITYELSNVGQAWLSKQLYAPLPTSFLGPLLTGFQGNF